MSRKVDVVYRRSAATSASVNSAPTAWGILTKSWSRSPELPLSRGSRLLVPSLVVISRLSAAS
eukprot:1698814-Prymnesium_polylepis.2